MPHHVHTDSKIVQVRKLLPFGLLVSLEDGREGIVREREISWDRAVRHGWREYFKPGDKLQAVLLGQGLDRRLELSLRLAQNDPWIDLSKRYRLGQVISGVVTGIQPYGVFVEIEPGVTGLFHYSKLPAALRQDLIEDLFWPGDHVKMTFELVDREQRRLDLSLFKPPQRWKSLPAKDAADGSTLSAPEHPLRLPLDLLLEQKAPLSVLIVEDGTDQREAVAKWLQRAGQHPITASNAEDALALLEHHHPNLVLMDLGLPQMNGLEAITLIRQRWPSLRCVLMTDWGYASAHLLDFDVLQVMHASLLIKPFLPEDLLNILFDISYQGDSPMNVAIKSDIALTNEVLSAKDKDIKHTDLNEIMAKLRRVTSASKIVLFKLDLAQGRVTAVAETGAEELNLAAFGDLMHSPVRDAAADRKTIHVQDALLVESRVRYLKPLMSFRSCIGIPVPGTFVDQYALFLFHPQPHAFNSFHKEYAVASALALSALLEREYFQARAGDMQRMALMGQLSHALVHDINHQLGLINFKLEDLAEQHGFIERNVHRSSSMLDAEIRQARFTLQQLATSAHHLTETTRFFGRVTIQNQDQLLSLTDVISQVVHLVRDMAERAHVNIEVESLAGVGHLLIRAIQIQQILLNLLINAIQQLALMRPKGMGNIRISVRQKSQGPNNILEIRVEDDGPGIHRRLWERIFDLGFTTRHEHSSPSGLVHGLPIRHEQGSGLGLYICRSLIESLKGQVYVAESYILWGSTFIIEMPVISM